jgi:hypothetical protein
MDGAYRSFERGLASRQATTVSPSPLYQAGSNGQAKGDPPAQMFPSGKTHRIRQGSDDAGKGYDAVSGWGVPNGTKLLSIV